MDGFLHVKLACMDFVMIKYIYIAWNLYFAYYSTFKYYRMNQDMTRIGTKMTLSGIWQHLVQKNYFTVSRYLFKFAFFKRNIFLKTLLSFKKNLIFIITLQHSQLLH